MAAAAPNPWAAAFQVGAKAIFGGEAKSGANNRGSNTSLFDTSGWSVDTGGGKAATWIPLAILAVGALGAVLIARGGK